MTDYDIPIPPAPTPMTFEQKRRIWGVSAITDPGDELTAPPLTVVQYGGVWSVVTGHRLPVSTGVARVDELIAEMTP